MSQIMCSQTLWHALGHRSVPPILPVDPVAACVLGPWAAKVFYTAGRGRVLALNEATYLTVVFPLVPRSDFRSNFRLAIEAALEDLSVGPDLIAQEVAPIDVWPWSRLTNRTLKVALNDLVFLCEAELDFSSDLRLVQRNLNEFPHADRHPHVPSEAAKLAFVTGRGSGRVWLH